MLIFYSLSAQVARYDINSEYNIVEKLGQGTYAQVMLGEQIDTQERVSSTTTDHDWFVWGF